LSLNKKLHLAKENSLELNNYIQKKEHEHKKLEQEDINRQQQSQESSSILKFIIFENLANQREENKNINYKQGK